ncbi:peptidoglycan-binding protein [Jiella sonneratiae]|uniref:Peptidoglycan-binding protein n=1 Tax=Jiella sonneratiae TaxID=2816856 RepID=A0ABS3J2Y7_9HYPH|nr:peptidoglycan-binding protein [Jiella sonneratiae]MBO0904029.1 peptidoglycan-binding protein [Jiella sonneratiae]
MAGRSRIATVAIAVAFFFPLLALAPPAAATVQRFGAFSVDKDVPAVIRLSGPIDVSGNLDFRRALRASGKADTLVLDSPGGSLIIALGIAEEILDRGLSTDVPQDAECLSACAFLFFAGKHRRVEGRLGVHQVSSTRSGDVGFTQLTLSNVLDLLQRADVDPRVMQVMLATPADEMHVFDAAEIATFGIERADDRPAELRPAADQVAAAAVVAAPVATEQTRAGPEAAAPSGETDKPAADAADPFATEIGSATGSSSNADAGTAAVLEARAAPQEAPDPFAIEIENTANPAPEAESAPDAAARDGSPQGAAPGETAKTSPLEDLLSGPDRTETTRQIQIALKEAGCDPGPSDGIWGSQTKSALEEFARRAELTFDASPSPAALEALKARTGRVCPKEAAPASCPTGQQKNSKGVCYTPVAVAPKRSAAPAKSAAPARTVTRETRSTRKQAASPARRSGGNCFSFNGQRYCE